MEYWVRYKYRNVTLGQRGSEHATPKYAILAWGLLWAESNWEITDTGKLSTLLLSD